jgi:hypothetical protein
MKGGDATVKARVFLLLTTLCLIIGSLEGTLHPLHANPFLGLMSGSVAAGGTDYQVASAEIYVATEPGMGFDRNYIVGIYRGTSLIGTSAIGTTGTSPAWRSVSVPSGPTLVKDESIRISVLAEAWFNLYFDSSTWESNQSTASYPTMPATYTDNTAYDRGRPCVVLKNAAGTVLAGNDSSCTTIKDLITGLSWSYEYTVR